MRLTGLGRLFVGLLFGIAIGAGMAVTGAVQGQAAGGEGARPPASLPDRRPRPAMPVPTIDSTKVFDAAAVIAWFSAFWALVETVFWEWLVSDMLVGELLDKPSRGDAAIVEQVATNTVGVQSALQSHAGVLVDALTRQTQLMERNIIDRTFGSLGMATLDNGRRRVNIGATAPSACRRANDARVLGDASRRAANVTRIGSERLNTHNNGYVSTTGALENLRRTLDQWGPRAFDMGWMQRDGVPPQGVALATQAIAYATNPMPLPDPPQHAGAGGSLAQREYAVRLAAHRELVKVPQNVLLRQLAMRAGENDKGSDAYLATVRAWAAAAIEDPLNPAILQHKTEKGLLAELQLSMSHLLWVQTEQLQADHERNAMLALMAADVLQRQGQDLRRLYEAAVRAD
jgi:hypothetical protein